MGLFAILRTISLIYHLLTLLILGVAIYAGLYLYTVGQVRVESVAFQDIGNITKEGFVISGSANISNGGIIPITVKEISYSLILNETGEPIGNGTIAGQSIPPDGSALFTYHQPVQWSPTIALAVRGATGQSTIVDVSGEIVLSHFGIYETRIPYTSTFDLGKYVKDALAKAIPEAVDVLTALAKGVGSLFS